MGADGNDKQHLAIEMLLSLRLMVTTPLLHREGYRGWVFGTGGGSSPVFYEYNHLQRKVEEDDPRIAVLGNVTIAELQFVHDAYHVVFIDIRRKADGKFRFFAIHVVQVGIAEIIHEVLTYHSLAIVQKTLLALTSQSCHLLAP